MQIYLPIAELSINVFLLLGMGAGIGILSGLFGVGGGFLLTPFLIFAGIPSPIAVATQANQTVATSLSGVLAHWSRSNVDLKMGAILTLGGFAGSGFGFILFEWLHRFGQIDLVISIAYVLLLSIVSIIMVTESLSAIRPHASSRPGRSRRYTWLRGLPIRMRFRKSGLYISLLLPLGIGFCVGVVSVIMGVGGAFIMVPAMIYLLRMPTSLAIGTSLFQIVFVSANVTFLQAQNRTVDGLLAFVLTIGSVVGAQIGGRLSSRLRGEYLRLVLAVLIMAVAIWLFLELVREPKELYSLLVVRP